MITFFLGSYDYFMQKEIFEQPESIVNTMRGRVNFDTYKGKLSGRFLGFPVCLDSGEISKGLSNVGQLY